MSALNVRFGADLSNLQKGIREAGASLRTFADSAQNVGRTLSRNVTLPIVAAGTAIFGAAIKAGNFADEIDKMSIRTGVSRTDLQTLRFASDQLGVSFDAIQSTIESFTRRLPQIEKGTSDSAVAFKRLGVDLKDADGSMRTMGEIYPDIIRSLSRLENETERNAIATQIFGRRAFEIVPLLNAGAGELDNMMRRAKELGIVMDDDAIASAVEFRDALNELKEQISAQVREIGMKFIPILKDTLFPLIQTKIVPAISRMIDRLGDLTKWFRDLTDGTRNFILVLGGIITIAGPVAFAIGKITKALITLRTVLLTLAGPKGWIALAVIALGGLIGRAAATKKEMSGLAGSVDDYTRSLKNMTRAELELERGELAKRIEERNEAIKRTAEHYNSIGTNIQGSILKGMIAWNEQTKDIQDALDEIDKRLKEIADPDGDGGGGDVWEDEAEAARNLFERLEELRQERDEIIGQFDDLSTAQKIHLMNLGMEIEKIEELIEAREKLTGEIEDQGEATEELISQEETLQKLLAKTPEHLGEIENKWKDVEKWAKNYEETLRELQSSIESLAMSSVQSFRDMARAVVQAARQVVAAKFAEAMASVLADAAAKFGILAPVIGATIGAAFSLLWNNLVPSFSQGGIVKGETLAMVGDYSGVSTNPEVIAPLNKLRDMMGGGTGKDQLVAVWKRDRVEWWLRHGETIRNRMSR